jgi:hypothetical protein
MIRKIVSGGQTGVDQAALDAAIKLGIPHGGWVPKGRKTENGPLPKKYNMQEMPNSNYSDRTEQNVLDSEGTLIISRGRLTDGSEYTRKMAMKHNRPWLHIDLSKKPKFHASTIVISWIDENRVEVLNVAGPRASKDPELYLDALNIIESVYYLGLINNGMPASFDREIQKLKQPYIPPQTIAEAIEQINSEMSLKAKTTIANMTEREVMNLNASLGKYIKDKFALFTGNQALMESCRFYSGRKLLHEDEASAYIIKKLWQKLRTTHKLRVVK